jgi:DNA-binding NarL/FixJ family response regulator
MKGKRHTTEEKIRILRAVDGGRSTVEICKEKNISEQTDGIHFFEPSKE